MPLISTLMPVPQTSNTTYVKIGKVYHTTNRAVDGCSSPSPRLWAGGEPLMSVTHGQCDARPTVTFPAARHHRPLAGTKLYCLVTEAHVCKQLVQGFIWHRKARTRLVDHMSSILTTRPPSHSITYILSDNWIAPWKNRTSWYIFFRPSLNNVLFPMFCLLVEGECQILVF